MKALAVFAIVGILLVSGCVSQSDQNRGEVKKPAASGDEKKTPVSVKVTMPVSVVNNCVGFLVGDVIESETISKIGGAWARPHPGPFSWGMIEKSKGSFSFEETDKWVKGFQENGVALLATLWPYAAWDQSTCQKQACQVGRDAIFYPGLFNPNQGIPDWRCSPCSYVDYKSFLKKLVERYDGDGLDDMPGLKMPVLHWEIMNEPSMNSGFLTFFKGAPEDYVQILKASFEAIKEACPNCKVVQGGAAGLDSNMIGFWETVLDNGGADYFDIANIHFVNFGDLTSLNVKGFKTLLDKKGVKKPIWVTEAEFDDEGAITISFEGALAAGAEKVFFSRFQFIKEFKGPKITGGYSKAYEGIAEKC